MSGMVTGDPVYRDAMGVAQAETGVRFDLESEPAWRDGPWDELGIAEVVWDLFDNVDDPVHADAISLGFKPIHQAMIGKQKTTPAFTSVFSFLDALASVRPGDVAAIGSLAAAATLDGHDQYWYAPDTARYTVIPADGSCVYDSVGGHLLQTNDYYGAIPDHEIGNKFFNRVFCRVVLPATGSWTIRARPVDVSGDPLAANIYLMRAGTHDITDDVVASISSEALTVNGPGGKVICFAIGSLAGPYCLAVSVGAAASPAPAISPAPPLGDG